jgi:hypothetical protein
LVVFVFGHVGQGVFEGDHAAGFVIVRDGLAAPGVGCDRGSAVFVVFLGCGVALGVGGFFEPVELVVVTYDGIPSPNRTKPNATL